MIDGISAAGYVRALGKRRPAAPGAESPAAFDRGRAVAARPRSENADPQLLALKVPPHSIEAEQSLLGALLLDNQAFDRVADLVTGEDFYRDDHRRLWRPLARRIEAAKPADGVP